MVKSTVTRSQQWYYNVTFFIQFRKKTNQNAYIAMEKENTFFVRKS